MSVGLAAFVLTSTGMALSARAKLWRIEGVNRKRLIDAGSSIDPMAMIFQNKRIKVTDLINPYDQLVIGKKFIDCEFIGPANLIPMLGEHGKFRGNHFDFSDSVEIRDGVTPSNAVGFVNCDIENCRFFKVTIFWQASVRKNADVIIVNQHWLTAVDEPQLQLENQPDVPPDE